MAGALCTFSTEIDISKLPRYDHNKQEATFEALIGIIHKVLNADISAGCVPMPIEKVNEAVYVVKVPDERLLRKAKFYLGISADVPEKELVVGTVQRIKMCSREKLDFLISSAMPGLQLMHTNRPPGELSTKPTYTYFSLSQQGDFWEGIKTTGSIAFYFPNEYRDLKMEMLALKN